MSEDQPSREWCDSCQRWIPHSKGFCPLFPGYRATRGGTTALPKWSECVCLTHTCYDAWPKLVSLTGFWGPKKVWHLGWVGKDWSPARTTKMLCSRKFLATGGAMGADKAARYLEGKSAYICKNCERRWQADPHEYRDFVGGL